MKEKNWIKKCLLILLGIFLIVFILNYKKGTYPFKELSSNQIKSVSVSFVPSETKIDLSNTEIAELVEILKSIVTYQKDDSYKNYSGQAVAFTINTTENEVIEIIEYSPFIIINKTGYKTKYDPCKKLSDFANELFQLSTE